MAVVFDTHSWIERLKEAGFTEEQAEAEVRPVREALATKQDLPESELRFEAGREHPRTHLESKVKDTESRLESKLAAVRRDLAARKSDTGRIKWLTGAIATGLPAQLLTSFGFL